MNRISATGSSKVFAVLDGLPAELRFMLYESAVQWSPLGVERLYRALCEDGYGHNAACHIVIEAYRDEEVGEIARFSIWHLATHGYLLAHIAAGVPIQRYRSTKRRKRS